MDNLKITVYQGYLFWENTDKNLQNISLRLSGIREKTNLIILPEMFNTGFTMNAEAWAKPWMAKPCNGCKKPRKSLNAWLRAASLLKKTVNFITACFGYALMARMSIMTNATFLPWVKNRKRLYRRHQKTDSRTKRLENLPGYMLRPAFPGLAAQC
jgi:hypothetical protein